MSRASELARFAEQDPSNPILLCDLLDELLTEGRVNDALGRLNELDTSMRALPAVRFREARCALTRGDFDAVIALLEPLQADMPEIPAGIAHDLAYALLLSGRLDEALKTLDQVRPQGEDIVAIALLRARILHRLQHLDLALESIAGISTGSRLAEIKGLRALLLLDLGKTSEAAQAALDALSVAPEQHEAAIVFGTVALWDHQVDVAQEMFERVVIRHPQSGRALLGLGQSWMLRGDVAAARGMLERTVAEMPDHIGSWHALAWCQLLQGDLAGARQSFDQAFKIDRAFGETHGGFALIHALRGERAEAEASIKRATRLDPDGASAGYAQSVLLLDEGHAEEAQRIVDGILSKSSGLPFAVPDDFILRLRQLVRPKG